VPVFAFLLVFSMTFPGHSSSAQAAAMILQAAQQN
jgi:hypothetical protein